MSFASLLDYKEIKEMQVLSTLSEQSEYIIYLKEYLFELYQIYIFSFKEILTLKIRPVNSQLFFCC